MPAKPSPERVSPPAAGSGREPGKPRNSFEAVLSVENPLASQRPSPTHPGVSAHVSPPRAAACEIHPHFPPPPAPSSSVRSSAASSTLPTEGGSSSVATSGDNLIVRSPSAGERSWRLDYSQFEAARKDPLAAAESSRRRWLPRKDPVIGYYQRQNEMIDSFVEMDALNERLLASPSSGAGPSSVLDSERMGPGERFAVNISNLANIVLLVAKILAAVMSRSLSIIASAMDSLLDCLSGFILWYTARSMQRHNPHKYPIGKKRMQPLGIIVFACIMAMLGLQILVEAVRQLMETDHHAGLGDNWGVYVGIMALAIVTKLALWLYCRSFANEIVQAYAQDHFFDVVTNVVGLGAAVLAGAFVWWIDPLGAILLSLYTMINWSKTVYENVRSLTGQSAPPEFLQKLTYLCWNHHEAILMIDTVRAYTFGSSYFTEVDVVLPSEMPLQEAHDIGESLQNKLESLPEIERAFVHLDYEVSHRPEHAHHAHANFKAPPGGPSVGGALGGPGEGEGGDDGAAQGQ